MTALADRGEDMKTSTRKPIARFAGLLLLALLVVALAVPAAQAMRDSSSGASGSSASAVIATSKPLQVPEQAVNQGVTTFSASSTDNAVQPASTDTSSTTAWIAIGGAVAVLIIALVTWTMIRRRRQPGEPAFSVDCALQPEDSLCRAG